MLSELRKQLLVWYQLLLQYYTLFWEKCIQYRPWPSKESEEEFVVSAPFNVEHKVCIPFCLITH